jgi:heptosyltransferase-2
MNLENKKILIIRLSSLGDIILTTPLLRLLKRKFPSAKIDYLCKAQFIDAVKHNPNVDKIYEYNESNELIEELKNSSYDLIIDLHNNFRSGKLASKLKVKRLYFSKPSLKKFLLVNFKINYLNPAVSIAERYISVVPGLKPDGKGAELFLTEGLVPELKENGNYIGICPGAQHFTKQYPLDYHFKLIKLIIKRDFIPVLFGGKSDRELCSKIKNEIPEVVDLSNDNKLLQTAANMKMCKLVICNDSGLMHTASALGVPVIALFGSTVREFGFSPYNAKNLILENN